MSFENNPEKIKELVDYHKKQFKQKKCMASTLDSNCNGKIIEAHTLSSGLMLKPISFESKVYAPPVANMSYSPYNKDIIQAFKLKKIGIGNVSTFNGFCAHHDKTLFSPLEDKPFYFEQQQLFMLMYRTVLKELYLKNASLNFIKSTLIEDPLLEMEQLLRAKGIVKSIEDIEKNKQKLDMHLKKEDWGRVINNILIFNSKPTLVASSPFYPEKTITGEILQDLLNFDIELSQLVFSIIPVEQNTKTAIIISYLDTEPNNTPNMFFNSIKEAKHKKAAIIEIILNHVENFAVSPIWYEGLDQARQEYFLKKMLLTSDTEHMEEEKEGEEIYNNSPFSEDEDWILESSFSI